MDEMSKIKSSRSRSGTPSKRKSDKPLANNIEKLKQDDVWLSDEDLYTEGSSDEEHPVYKSSPKKKSVSPRIKVTRDKSEPSTSQPPEVEEREIPEIPESLSDEQRQLLEKLMAEETEALTKACSPQKEDLEPWKPRSLKPSYDSSTEDEEEAAHLSSSDDEDDPTIKEGISWKARKGRGSVASATGLVLGSDPDQAAGTSGVSPTKSSMFLDPSQVPGTSSSQAT